MQANPFKFLIEAEGSEEPRRAPAKKRVVKGATVARKSASRKISPLPETRTVHSTDDFFAAPIPVAQEEQKPEEKTKTTDVKTAQTPATAPSSIVRQSTSVDEVFRRIELLHEVLGFLEQQDLISTRSVCKPWDIVAGAMLSLPSARTLGDLIGILGDTKYHGDFTSKMYTLDFDFYDVSPKKLALFVSFAKTITKLDLNFKPSKRATSPDEIMRIAPEVFMALAVLCKKASPSQDTFFIRLEELTISHDLFSIYPHAFTPMFLPPTTRTLTISDLGCISIRTVFGYLASVGSCVEECTVFGSAMFPWHHESFKASGLEKAPNLLRLNCKRLANGWGFFQALSGSCPGLKELYVEFGVFLPESQPKKRNITFPALQTLTLLHCHPLQVEAMTNLFQSALFVAIREVTISFKSEIETDTMEQLLLALKSSCGATLQSLSISVRGSSSSWDQHHFQVLREMENLHTLKIEAAGGKMNVEDNEFRLLCLSLPNLQSLVLEAELTLLTFNALKFCNINSSRNFVNIYLPITGSILGYSSSLGLPPSLLSLGLRIVGLEERNLTPFAASITSICPSNTSVVFDGSPAHLISSLVSTFLTLHTWRRNSEEKTKAELRNMKRLYEQALAERDQAIRRQRSLEAMIGDEHSIETPKEP